MEMVEKVADAMHDKVIGEISYATCRMLARAAIEVMEDATPEMIRALKPGMDQEEVYTSMIRAALESR